MKYLKMLGLAAIAAMALMAFLGASSASATVICKTKPTGGVCPSEWMVNSGQEISASLEGTAILESTGGETLDTCTGGSVNGATEQTGGSTETVSIKTKAEGGITWSGCTATTDTVSAGTVEFHRLVEPENALTVTVNEAKVTVSIFGVSCTYGFESAYEDIGIFIPNEPNRAQLKISTLVRKRAGGFLCPAEARWTATYGATTNEGHLWGAAS